jgi:hypothetical protein
LSVLFAAAAAVAATIATPPVDVDGATVIIAAVPSLLSLWKRP